jgi:serine/threonine-protein kinase
MSEGARLEDPLIGRTLDGRYRIEKRLGEGGMGIVYKAVHTTLGKALAIKVLRPEVSKNEEILQRFRQEAQSASQIGNPHIIDISDFGTLPDGSTYFVMEFLTGQSLTATLAQGTFGLARTTHIARQLCSALSAAHAVGIVHRDLKPDNVQLIERAGQKDFVKVLDFGIAKVGGNASKLTQAGQIFGTPHYMSPEQCAGSDVDQRTDIYAVGVILYEMVAGRVPFDAENLMGILTKQLYENPVPPSQLEPPADIAPELEAVILKCLQKKPEARYQTMAELGADIDALDRGVTPKASTERALRMAPLAGPETLDGVEARISAGASAPEFALRKSKTPLYTGVLLAVAVAVAGLWVIMGGSHEPSEVTNADKAAAGASTTSAPLQPTAAMPGAEPVAAAEPSAAPPASDPPLLTVTSHPELAEIYVDGTLVGTTPWSVAKPVQGSSLEFEVRRAGYQSKSLELTERSQDLDVSLQKRVEPPSRPTPSRPRTESPPPRAPKPAEPKTPTPTPKPAPTPNDLDPWR